MEIEHYRTLMEERLGKKLYRHSLGVAGAASALAVRYGAERSRAYLAGLLHDYGKVYSKEELCLKAESLGLRLDRITLSERRLLHAPVGAALLQFELGLAEASIIRAVAYHTTGCGKMTLLEKVLYLADLIEPGRDFDGVGELRKIAFDSLEPALLTAVNQTIQSVIRRGMLLHPRSVQFRNSLLDGLTENGG